MRKIIAFVIALVTVAAMAVPAYACTPKLKVPSVPSVPKFKVQITLPEDFWSDYFAKNPIKFN